MTRFNSFMAAILITAVATFAANKNIRGAMVTNLNDRPVIQAMPDSSGGQSDTLFINGTNPANTRDSVFNTSLFNTIRIPYSWSGMNGASSLIAKNPDSVVCNFVANRVDADVGSIAFGIKFRISPNLWSAYGGTAGTDTTFVAATKYRVTAPWVAGKGFRPYFVTTSSTDTTKIRFVECKDLTNP